MSVLDDGWSFQESPTDRTDRTDRPEARLAVRLAFIVAGGGLGCVAALMPCLAHRVGLDARGFAVVALSLLAGACAGTRGAGAARWLGPGRQVLIGGLGSALVLPAVALVGTPAMLAVVLFVFGGCAGVLDAATHASADAFARDIQRARRPGLRAIYGVAAAGGGLVTTLLLAAGFEPPLAAALVAAPMMIATVVAWPHVMEK